jgi:predicted CXXCH cytochrome family protein
MKPMTIRTRLPLALLIATTLGASAQEVAAQGGCVTAQCHVTLLKGKHAHAATDACDNCHESSGAPHPQKGKPTFALTQPVPALCQTCHDALGTRSRVHPPVKDGSCTVCHDPHSADQPKLLTQPLKELCTTCHSSLEGLKHPHGPVAAGDCLSCHAPHESDTPALLVRQGDELCSTCHLEAPAWQKKAEVHPALAGGCTSCHNPHGAEHPKLLAEEGAALCFQCHDPIAEKVQKSPVVHAALSGPKACGACHSPHASDQRKLLLAPEKETCLACHKTVLPPGAAFVHGPIGKGLCSPCHEPHGGRNPRLLLQPFPQEAYVPYTGSEYGLCFTCHNRDLVQYPDTSFATNFRDGERNLHYLHVNNPRKGRSCRLCHDLHGSNSPRLVADSVPFGKWRLPLKFVKTETGGGCSPGCHRPFTYDRRGAGRKPEPPKPGGR